MFVCHFYWLLLSSSLPFLYHLSRPRWFELGGRPLGMWRTASPSPPPRQCITVQQIRKCKYRLIIIVGFSTKFTSGL